MKEDDLKFNRYNLQIHVSEDRDYVFLHEYLSHYTAYWSCLQVA